MALVAGPFGTYLEERVAPPGAVLPNITYGGSPSGASGVSWRRSSVGAPNPLAGYGIDWNPNDPRGPAPASLPGFDAARRLFPSPAGFAPTYRLPFAPDTQLYFDPGAFSGFGAGPFGIPASFRPAPEQLPQWRVGTTLDNPMSGSFLGILNQPFFSAILSALGAYYGGAALNAVGGAGASATGAGLAAGGGSEIGVGGASAAAQAIAEAGSRAPSRRFLAWRPALERASPRRGSARSSTAPPLRGSSSSA